MSKSIAELIRYENLNIRENPPGEEGYVTDRNWLKYLFSDIETHTNKDTKVLEVGCGNGNSLIDICRESHISASNCIGTSLQPLPQHKLMKEYGIQVKTGIIAEDLPISWQEKFDVTMACAMLMHVDDLTMAMNKLLRVTALGGHILIYDLRQNIEIANSIAKQQNHKIIKPKNPVIKNMFGSIIKKTSKMTR